MEFSFISILTSDAPFVRRARIILSSDWYQSLRIPIFAIDQTKITRFSDSKLIFSSNSGSMNRLLLFFVFISTPTADLESHLCVNNNIYDLVRVLAANINKTYAYKFLKYPQIFLELNFCYIWFESSTEYRQTEKFIHEYISHSENKYWGKFGL